MRSWDLERQVRFIAGLLVLTGMTIGFAADRRGFYLACFVGLGLTFSGLTDVCAMRALLARLPWNKGK